MAPIINYTIYISKLHVVHNKYIQFLSVGLKNKLILKTEQYWAPNAHYKETSNRTCIVTEIVEVKINHE